MEKLAKLYASSTEPECLHHPNIEQKCVSKQKFVVKSGIIVKITDVP